MVLTHAQIDCGATGIASIHQEFASHPQIPLQELKHKWQLEDIDRRPIESGDITHLGKVSMTVQDHQEQIPMSLTELRHCCVVLGILWLDLHDVKVEFSLNTVSFGSQFRTTNRHYSTVTVQASIEDVLELVYTGKQGDFEQNVQPSRPLEGNILVMLSSASVNSTLKM